MNKCIKHGDSNLIWFDFDNIDLDALENIVVSEFDITNMPSTLVGKDLLGNDRYSPNHFELKNYYVTFFYDKDSRTNYSCSCINKDKRIYKSKLGYCPKEKRY